ncbi:MAG: outer membrane beta-barrel protein, partial [Croceibacterium sp.]
MRKIALGMAVAVSAIAAPALAKDGQAYIGLDSGVVVDNSVDFRINGRDNAATIDQKLGWELGGLIGYDFGMIRTEAEMAYREQRPDSVSSPVVGVPRFTTAPVAGTYSATNGEMRTVTAMANALLDIGGEDGIGFSIGAGAGHAWVSGENTVAVGPGWFDDSDHNWAWQGLAQMRVPITDQAEIGLKYRYLNTMRMNYRDTAGRANSFELASHSAMISLIANLGAS